MDFLDDPEEMVPEERLAEVAAILAAGYLRLRQARAALAAESPPFTEKPLDCPRPPAPVLGLTPREAGEVAG